MTRCVCVYVEEYERKRGRQRHCFQEVLLPPPPDPSPLNAHSASFTSVPESWHHSASDPSVCITVCFSIQSPPFRAIRADPRPECCLAGALTTSMSGFQAEQQAPADLR